jgi:Predicted ATPase of the ABC class
MPSDSECCSQAQHPDDWQEALEVGATTLLLDEDTCASNFMHRDDRMRVRRQRNGPQMAQCCGSSGPEQASNVVIAVHGWIRCLLQALVPTDPITPFSERVKALEAAGVSCVSLYRCLALDSSCSALMCTAAENLLLFCR